MSGARGNRDGHGHMSKIGVPITKYNNVEVTPRPARIALVGRAFVPSATRTLPRRTSAQAKTPWLACRRMTAALSGRPGRPRRNLSVVAS